jgi:uncharacterized repeat protein (TIGR02543 family)
VKSKFWQGPSTKTMLFSWIAILFLLTVFLQGCTCGAAPAFIHYTAGASEIDIGGTTTVTVEIEVHGDYGDFENFTWSYDPSGAEVTFHHSDEQPSGSIPVRWAPTADGFGDTVIVTGVTSGTAVVAIKQPTGSETILFTVDEEGAGPPEIRIIQPNEALVPSVTLTMAILTMTVNGHGSTTPVAGGHEYSVGETVEITATPADGYQFDGWTGDIFSSSSASTTVIMDISKTITANFSEVPLAMVTLTMAVNGYGSTTPVAGGHEYSVGETVEITATPADGWQFDGWTGAVVNPSSASTTIIMDISKTIIANFSEVPLSLTGVWKLEVFNVNSSCGPESGWNSEVTIVQEGEELETTGIKGTTFVVAGTVIGDTVTIGPGSFPDQGGTTTATYTMTIKTDALMEGTEQWTWTDGTTSCSGGTATIRMTRIS